MSSLLPSLLPLLLSNNCCLSLMSAPRVRTAQNGESSNASSPKSQRNSRWNCKQSKSHMNPLPNPRLGLRLKSVRLSLELHLSWPPPTSSGLVCSHRCDWMRVTFGASKAVTRRRMSANSSLSNTSRTPLRSQNHLMRCSLLYHHQIPHRLRYRDYRAWLS